VVGAAVFNAMVSRRSLRAWLDRTYVDAEAVTDELIDVCYAAAHQPGARYAPSAFFSGHLDIDIRRALRRLTQPAMIVWGEQAIEAPVEDVRGFRALRPDLEVAILDPAGSLPHDERPDEFNEIATTFLASLRATA
jgi:pimeloyl-ACP methyl ester carboxylesterase